MHQSGHRYADIPPVPAVAAVLLSTLVSSVLDEEAEDAEAALEADGRTES